MMTLRMSGITSPSYLKHVDVVALPLGSHGPHALDPDPRQCFCVNRRLGKGDTKNARFVQAGAGRGEQ